jgi:ATP-dependent Clp protease ATP-binding subunit ClpA
MSRSISADQSVGAHRGQAQNPPKDSESAHPDDPSASGNLDKIRDILFGAQAREQDRRFAQLEQHLIREAADLRNDLRRRFESLEGYIKKEVDALTSRLTKEQEVRGESVTQLTADLTQLAAALEEKARQLGAQASQAQSHLLQQLVDRTGDLAAEVQARHAETRSALTEAIHDLRTEKTDRATLAAILLEASQRLTNEEASSSRA